MAANTTTKRGSQTVIGINSQGSESRDGYGSSSAYNNPSPTEVQYHMGNTVFRLAPSVEYTLITMA